MPIIPFITVALSWLGRIGVAVFAVDEIYKLSAGDKDLIEKSSDEAQAAGMSEDEHKKLVAATTYEQVEKAGKEPEDFWAGLTPEEQDKLKFSPTSLKNDMGRTKFLGLSSALLFAGSLVAGGVAATKGIPILLKTIAKLADARAAGASAASLMTIIEEGKILGIAKVWIPGLIAGIAAAGGWLTSSLTNNLNDATLWGRIFLGQAADDFAKAQKTNTSGGYAQTPKTRVAEYKTAKPKLFTGIIFNGQVGKFDQFVRAVDDEITDDADLKADVEINLLRYISKIPNNLSYSIQIKNSPNDELGIPRSGTWCTLSIYLTNQFHKRVFIDEILLGPVDPYIYYPESQRVEQLQYEIPKLVKFDNVHPIDTYRGQERIVSTTGEIITDVLRDGSRSLAGMSVAAEQAQDAAVIAAGTEKAIPNSISAEGVSQHNQPPLFGTLYKVKGNEALSFNPWPELYTPEEINKLSQDPNKWAQNEQKLKDRGVDTSQVRQFQYHDLEPFWKLPMRPASFAEFFGVSSPTAGFPKQVHVLATKLNVRSQPTSQSATAGSKQLVKGDVFTAVALVEGEAVNGNNKWWKSSLGNYVWSGGTD